MKIIEKTVSLSAQPELNRLCPDEHPLFFDIETTGLAAGRSQLYLIGACSPEKKGEEGEETWRFIQWLARNPEEELDLLSRFLEFASSFDRLIHFNGTAFDLPYLHKKADFFGLSDCLDSLPGIDLCQRLRPCRNFLGLPNGRLKTWEAFLGLTRTDEYSGGELIDIYRRYVRKPDTRGEALLLLHNEEDILGLPALLPLLSYADFLCGSFTVEEKPERKETKENTLFLLRLNLLFPRPVRFEEEGWQGQLRGDLLRLSVPKRTGELRYFLPNYQDYYYLPAEDTAIHKSVAAYVDQEFREKATRKTGYLRREGTFLKLPGEMPGRLFRPEYGGDCYREAGDPCFEEPSFWTEYLRRLVCLLH